MLLEQAAWNLAFFFHATVCAWVVINGFTK